MPPRKRTRTSQVASQSPESHAKTITPEYLSPVEHPLCAHWTDEEEVGLFKGLIRWKPTGIHKHFKLLALHHYLLSNEYISSNNEHTRPSGIWYKLQSLYDLEALDLREDARQLSELSEKGDSDEAEEEEKDDGYYNVAENKIHNSDFALPEDDEYADLIWKQRLLPSDNTNAESPPAMPDLNTASIAPVRFTPSFSVEPDDLGTANMKRSRGRPKGRKNMRSSGASETTTTTTRRSTRHVESMADDEEVADSEAAGEGSEGDDEQLGKPDDETVGDNEGDDDEISDSDDAHGEEDDVDSVQQTQARTRKSRRKLVSRTSTRVRGRTK